LGPVPKDVHPPGWCIEAVETWGYWPGVRELETITRCPYVLADGSLSKPSFDHENGTLYRPSVTLDDLPAELTRDDAVEAATHLQDLLIDFPWASGSDFAVWLAALLTAIQRPCIEGPVPGFAFNGNKAGTGKGLLIDVLGLIAWGHVVPTRTY